MTVLHTSCDRSFPRLSKENIYFISTLGKWLPIICREQSDPSQMIPNFVKMADSSRWQLIECDWQLPKVDHLLSHLVTTKELSSNQRSLRHPPGGHDWICPPEAWWKLPTPNKSSQSPTNKASLSLAQVLLNKAADCPALDALESGACVEMNVSGTARHFNSWYRPSWMISQETNDYQNIRENRTMRDSTIW